MSLSSVSIAKKRREPLSDSQLLMTITIGIFLVMYGAAMLFMGGGFLRTQQLFDLLNDNAALIIISCSLTIVMIGGGINISVGGVIGLTVMACAIFLNENELLFRVQLFKNCFFNEVVFLLSLISKHEMLRMGLVMADGKFTYRQTASAADANLVKIESNERVFKVFV
jgi:ribose/xylose/arabinose/galactoside ABC-type transport system permease subunit